MPLLFFAYTSPENRFRLWRSDGTGPSTQLVADVQPSASRPSLNDIVQSGNLGFFTNSTGDLWRTDGTTLGTFKLADFTFVSRLTDIDGTLFFIADDGVRGAELYRTDGTPQGTFLVKELVVEPFFNQPSFGSFTEVGGRLFFTADVRRGSELWTSDGTAAGTFQVKEINPSFSGSDITEIVDLNGVAYFLANDGVHGLELWRSDGTEPGTFLVKDSPSVENSGSLPRSDVIVFNGSVYFTTVAPGGTDLWRSDGTANGTVLVSHVNSQEFFRAELYRSDTHIYLLVRELDFIYNLFVSDGVSNTQLIASLGYIPPLELSAQTYAFEAIADGAKFYFGVYTQGLFVTQGTAATTVRLGNYNPYYSDMEVVGDTVYFSADQGNGLGHELYRTDGTVEGTVLVRDLNTLNPPQSDGSSVPHAFLGLDALRPSYPGIASGDFNGDGKDDILWRHADGTLTMWQMNGAQIASAAGVAFVDNAYRVSGTGDFDGDNKADILWRAPNGNVNLWLMDGSAIKQAAIIANAPRDYNIQAVGDFNGDGKADILFRNNDGWVTAWLMDGTRIAEAGTLGQANFRFSIEGVGDFNGDGKDDILFRHTDGSVAMWQLDGLSPTPLPVGVAGPEWEIQGIGDLTGDGKDDILWRTEDVVALWQMDGATPTGIGLGGADLSQAVQALGDYDGDHVADILFRSEDGLVNLLDLAAGAVITGHPNVAPVTLDYIIVG